MEQSIETLRVPMKKKKSNFIKNHQIFLFIIPALVYVFIFSYLPMYGVVIAFQDFVPGDNMLSLNAQWIGWDNFQKFFQDYQFVQLLKNTFYLCIYGFIIGFPLPIMVALLLNSLKSQKFSKRLQTIFYAPHFISLVVMVGMLYLFFGSSGLVNQFMKNVLHMKGYDFFLQAKAFRPLYILSGNWQDFGWSAIIYLAALSGVNPQLHEAAVVDGASRFKRVLHIDLPAILPTISLLLILSIGNLMSVGYEKAYLMQTGANLSHSEIISTYVYRRGIKDGNDYGYATAVGLFNSAVNVGLLIIANTLSKKFSKNSLW